MAVITLTSDIGDSDFITGAIKGRLLNSLNGATIADITHNLLPFNLPQAAYICRNAIRHFPKGSFHLVYVNMYQEKPTHLLLAKHHDQYILCPDNGFLTMLLEELPEEVVALPLQKSENKTVLYFTHVFAEAIRKVESGAPLAEVGQKDIDIHVTHSLKPMLGKDWMEGQIIFIDNFENVVINITREQFEEQRKERSFQIMFRREEFIDKISESYADVSPGEKLATFNTAGYLEISMNKGNAASLFGFRGYQEIQHAHQENFLSKQMLYQTIKIYFID